MPAERPSWRPTPWLASATAVMPLEIPTLPGVTETRPARSRAGRRMKATANADGTPTDQRHRRDPDRTGPRRPRAAEDAARREGARGPPRRDAAARRPGAAVLRNSLCEEPDAHELSEAPGREGVDERADPVPRARVADRRAPAGRAHPLVPDSRGGDRRRQQGGDAEQQPAPVGVRQLVESVGDRAR